MGISRRDLQNWYNRGVEDEKTHMIVVCDTFDYEDFPVYVGEGESVSAEVSKRSNSQQMSRVMEVYDLSLPFDDQRTNGGGLAWSL